MCFMQDMPRAVGRVNCALSINSVCVFFHEINTKPDDVLRRLAEPKRVTGLVDEIVRNKIPCDHLRDAQALLMAIHPFWPPVEELANRVLTAAIKRVWRAA